MNLKRYVKTMISFLVTLSHLVYLAMLAAFDGMASLLETPCDREGIYTVFAIGFVILLFAYPLVATLINATSIGFSIQALCTKESKIINIVWMVFILLYEVAVVLFFVYFWKGAMSA